MQAPRSFRTHVPQPRGPWRRRLIIALSCTVLGGCFKLDDGREPPLDRIYFPSGVALSPGGSRLYVANSDWDLQFNAGTVQAFDLDRLRELLPRYCDADEECNGGERCDLTASERADGTLAAPTHWCVDVDAADPCGERGVQTAAQRALAPGLCGPIEQLGPDLLLDSVSIGAFATDLAFSPNPNGGGRLFVPVRSDATLHWIDVSGDEPGISRELECGQSSEGQCDGDHRRGDGPGETSREDEELPIEPYGVAVTEDGEAIVTTHQTEGQLALFVNDWDTPEQGPVLESLLGGLQTRVIAVAAVPMSRLVLEDRALGVGRQLDYQPGFWISYRNSPVLDLVRYYDAIDADGRPFLERTAQAGLTPVGLGDVRGIGVDATARRTCEAACAAGDVTCLTTCAGVGLDVFLANRLPASVLSGHTVPNRSAAGSGDDLVLADLTPVGDGPSRAVVGGVLDEAGQVQQRVFIVSFESRSIDIYDPVSRTLEARVYTGRGPNSVAIDAARGLGYVAHFTDSFLGVIDLDRRHTATYGTMIMTLGRPVAPRGSQ
jgi:DNA-binding beta-propeller fold protein YncE